MLDYTKSLKDISAQIREHVQGLQDDTLSKLELSGKRIAEINEEYRKALAESDLRENASYLVAKSDLGIEQTNYANLEKMAATLSELEESDYRSIGIVTLYTTVRLKSILDNKEYVIKIYPDGISDVDNGVIAMNSPIGTALLRKTVGDFISVGHKTVGLQLKYQIMEIY